MCAAHRKHVEGVGADPPVSKPLLPYLPPYGRCTLLTKLPQDPSHILMTSTGRLCGCFSVIPVLHVHVRGCKKRNSTLISYFNMSLTRKFDGANLRQRRDKETKHRGENVFSLLIVQISAA